MASFSIAAGPAAPTQKDTIAAAVAEAHAAREPLLVQGQAGGGTWMLLRAPEPLAASAAVTPPEPPPLAAISRRVKMAFDPRGILNPGRMCAGL